MKPSLKPARLWVDQYGHHVYARTVTELRDKAGGGRISKMYVDSNGQTVHIGYVVGPHWFAAYAPVEAVQ